MVHIPVSVSFIKGANAEMEKYIDTPVKRYSSGMYVKLAFSVAAHLDSEILIMDEVLAVGDMAFQKKCLDKMRDAAKKEGRTVLYVSHNMNTIRQLCDRCVVLDKGKVVFEGDVEEAIEVYLQNTSPDIKTELILTDIKRPSYFSGNVLMERILFENSTAGVYRKDQKIPVTLIWKGLRKLEDIHARILVMASDGAPIGLTFSETLGDVLPEERIKSRLELEFPGLVEGKYYLTISLFQKDSLGNSIILDTLERFCSFQIGGAGESKLNWPIRAWGSINFPNIRIVKE